MADQDAKRNVIQFSLAGLVVFSAALVLAGGLLALVALQAKATKGSLVTWSDVLARDAGPAPSSLPPWGELIANEIEVDRPAEYVAFDIDPPAPHWVFEQTSPEQARERLVSSGLNFAQADRALATATQDAATGDTTILPDEALIRSLSPAVRSKLYLELGKSKKNRYQRDPFRLHRGDLEKWFSDGPLEPAFVRGIGTLLYPRGNILELSDFELLVRKLPDDKQKLYFAKTLSRQRAIVARLRIRKDTDLDKLIGYWGNSGVHAKDLRPLFESLQRLPDGGVINIVVALPPFARERVYTYPMPDGGGAQDQAKDCHWSTMNFFNELPDDRFLDPVYAAQFLRERFYMIAKPSQYGDRVFFVTDDGNAVHSAVYIADDIVFTKNGIGFEQPWTLMHMHDLLDMYGSAQHVKLVAYRERER